MSLSEMMNSDGGAAPAGAAPAGVAPAGDQGNTPAGGAAADAPLQYADWMSAFGTDPLEEGGPSPRDWLAKKGFKTPDELARAARETEKAFHSRIPIPAAGEAEKWGELYDKLGRPKTPEEYKIGAPDGMQTDPTLTGAFAARAHAAGLSQAQVEQVVGWWNETAIGSLQQQAAAVDAQKAALQSEWGGKYGENMQFMRRGARALGLDDAGVDKLGGALGVDGAAKLLANLGRRTSEDMLRDGDSMVTSLSEPELETQLRQYDRENGPAIRSGDAKVIAERNRLISQLAAAKKANAAQR